MISTSNKVADERMYEDNDICSECGGDEDPFWWQSACFDDLCHGGEVPCMHGDYSRLRCPTCGK